MDTLRSRTIALALLWCAPAISTGGGAPGETQPFAPAEAREREEVLDEILISGARPSRKPSEIIAWMRRLVGQFVYEGHVDLGGQGNPEEQRPVRGQADCVGFGPAPALQCEIRVTWPGVVQAQDKADIPGTISNLNPAMILYGFEPDEVAIRFMQVDSNGIAEPSLGLLVGDTLIARGPCVNQPGNCQRSTRITAAPDIKVVEMHVDIEVEFRRAQGYRFVLRLLAPPPVAN